MPLKSAGLMLVGLVIATAAAPAARAADPDKGKVVFQRCAACHGGQDKADVGPPLAGVFGRTAAGAEDFRYSAAMRRSKVVWDDKSLDGYLADPQNFIKGNRMPFAGVPDAADRADLIAYIKTLK